LISTGLETVLDTKTGKPGTVTAIQTYGDYGRWHPHLHLLVADGLFMPNGSFYVMLNIDLKPLQELFRATVLKMLKKEGKIDGCVRGPHKSRLLRRKTASY
jgi:hypothetical protein